MTDAINYTILDAVEDGPLPLGFVHQTYAPVNGRDIALRGGSFLRSAYPRVQGLFKSPVFPGTGFVGSGSAGYATPPTKPVLKVMHVNGRVFGLTAATSLYELVAGAWVVRTVTGIPTPQVWDICYLNGAYYMISVGVIYKSTDGLASATAVGAGVSGPARIIAFDNSLIVMSYDPYTAYYYYGTTRFHRSDNGGATWSQFHTVADNAGAGGAGAGWHSQWRSCLFISGGRLYASYRWTIGEGGFVEGSTGSYSLVWSAGVPTGPSVGSLGIDNTILNIVVDDEGRFVTLHAQGSTYRATAFKAGTTTGLGEVTLNLSGGANTSASAFIPATFAYGAVTAAQSSASGYRYWHFDAELVLEGAAYTATNLDAPQQTRGVGHADSKSLIFFNSNLNPNQLVNDASSYLAQFSVPNLAVTANNPYYYMRAR